MGLELLGGNPTDWGKYAQTAFNTPKETLRRQLARRRICLYRDDFESVLQEQLGILFRDEAVRLQFYRLARLAGSSSFLKRVSDEVSRPVYSTPPVRRVKPAGAADKRGSDPNQAKYAALAKRIQLNQTMDLAARLVVACAPVFLIGRYIKDDGPTLDVATGDCVSVIPDPRKPTRALAIAYEQGPGQWVVADDKRTFQVNANGIASAVEPHDLGRIPVVEIHRRGRWGTYWDSQGQDLEVAALSMMFIDAVILKKHKSQSHIQLAFAGDSDGIPKNQVLDEESILMINGQGQLTPIDLQADPTGLLKTKAALETTVAAAYGLSQARLNQEKDASDQGLTERTAEIMAVMGDAEADAFDLLQRLSQSDTPDKRIAEGLEFSADYRAISNRMDPMQELAYWKELRANGLRSIVDDAFALNPELQDEVAAWTEINRNMEDEAVYIAQRRALNIAEDANVNQPGQDPQSNGAMGPAVRDGKMSKDEAAMQAESGDSSAASDGETTRVFKIGDRVLVVPGEEHMPEHKGVPGTVKIVKQGAYGVLFDGTSNIHKWYAGDELTPATE